MLQLPDVIRLLNDLLSPVVILGIQLVGPEAELAGGGTNDLFIIDVQGDPVALGKLLGQGFLITSGVPRRRRSLNRFRRGKGSGGSVLWVCGETKSTSSRKDWNFVLWEAVSPLLMSGTIL